MTKSLVAKRHKCTWRSLKPLRTLQPRLPPRNHHHEQGEIMIVVSDVRALLLRSNIKKSPSSTMGSSSSTKKSAGGYKIKIKPWCVWSWSSPEIQTEGEGSFSPLHFSQQQPLKYTQVIDFKSADENKGILRISSSLSWTDWGWMTCASQRKRIL